MKIEKETALLCINVEKQKQGDPLCIWSFYMSGSVRLGPCVESFDICFILFDIHILSRNCLHTHCQDLLHQ